LTCALVASQKTRQFDGAVIHDERLAAQHADLSRGGSFAADVAVAVAVHVNDNDNDNDNDSEAMKPLTHGASPWKKGL
jgi:hypothetical protein